MSDEQYQSELGRVITERHHKTAKLHEINFPVQASSTVNVNSVGPELVMAWLLHRASMCRGDEPTNYNRFLEAARLVAVTYSYMPMADRVLTSIASDLMKGKGKANAKGR